MTTREGHTPGPWAVDDGEALKVKGADGATVASMFFASLTRRRTSEEVHANAKLIAAAPALYEALKAAERALTRASNMLMDTQTDEAVRCLKAASDAVTALQGVEQ